MLVPYQRTHLVQNGIGESREPVSVGDPFDFRLTILLGSTVYNEMFQAFTIAWISRRKQVGPEVRVHSE